MKRQISPAATSASMYGRKKIIRNQTAPAMRPATISATPSASGNWTSSETTMMRPLLTSARTKVALPSS